MIYSILGRRLKLPPELHINREMHALCMCLHLHTLRHWQENIINHENRKMTTLNSTTTSPASRKAVFISGSRTLSRLDSQINGKLEKIIAEDMMVLVGDANGADKAVQTFFSNADIKT